MKYHNNIFKGNVKSLPTDKIDKLINLVYDKDEHKILKVLEVQHCIVKGSHKGINTYIKVKTEHKDYSFKMLYHNSNCYEYQTAYLPLYASKLHFKIDLKNELNKQEALAQTYLKNYNNKLKDIENLKIFL